MAHKGYLIVADITGYTAYLSSSELEHAQEILEGLLNAILKRVHPPMVISRTEGDAVFAYTLDNAFSQGQTLLEAIEQIYCTFLSALERNRINTTCQCAACNNMQILDLKAVVHFGEFGLQKLGGHLELVGSDVNLTHRLLKNHVIEQTGVKAYAFFSQAAIQAMNLEEYAAAHMQPHAESYDHLGEVQGWVHDLKNVYAAERDKHRLKITPDQAAKSRSLVVPASPTHVWDRINEPNFRAQYKMSEVNRTSGIRNGRLAEGTVYHCAHGDVLVDEQIVDWQPFDYVTVEGVTTVLGVAMEYWYTVILTPVDEGMRIDLHLTNNRSRNPLLRPLGAVIWQRILKSKFFWNIDQYFRAFEEAFATDTQTPEPATA